jgi:hypothetical protein
MECAIGDDIVAEPPVMNGKNVIGDPCNVRLMGGISHSTSSTTPGVSAAVRDANTGDYTTATMGHPLAVMNESELLPCASARSACTGEYQWLRAPAAGCASRLEI